MNHLGKAATKNRFIMINMKSNQKLMMRAVSKVLSIDI